MVGFPNLAHLDKLLAGDQKRDSPACLKGKSDRFLGDGHTTVEEDGGLIEVSSQGGPIPERNHVDPLGGSHPTHE